MEKCGDCGGGGREDIWRSPPQDDLIRFQEEEMMDFLALVFREDVLAKTLRLFSRNLHPRAINNTVFWENFSGVTRGRKREEELLSFQTMEEGDGIWSWSTHLCLPKRQEISSPAPRPNIPSFPTISSFF